VIGMALTVALWIWIWIIIANLLTDISAMDWQLTELLRPYDHSRYDGLIGYGISRVQHLSCDCCDLLWFESNS